MLAELGTWGPAASNMSEDPARGGTRDTLGGLVQYSTVQYSSVIVQYSTVQYSGGTRDTLRGLVHRNLANKATMAEN